MWPGPLLLRGRIRRSLVAQAASEERCPTRGRDFRRCTKAKLTHRPVEKYGSYPPLIHRKNTGFSTVYPQAKGETIEAHCQPEITARSTASNTAKKCYRVITQSFRGNSGSVNRRRATLAANGFFGPCSTAQPRGRGVSTRSNDALARCDYRRGRGACRRV